MADLRSIIDTSQQLGTREKIQSLLGAAKEQIESVVQRLSAMKSGNNSGGDAMQGVIDELNQTIEGLTVAHTAAHEAQQDSGPFRVVPTDRPPSETGDPSNPLQNPAPGNPVHIEFDPPRGETGDGSNPAHNTVPDPKPDDSFPLHQDHEKEPEEQERRAEEEKKKEEGNS